MDVNANFVACLALHQQRRDSAIGLYHVTTRQRYLLWYYNTLMLHEQEKQNQLIADAFHYGIIQGGRERIEQIKAEITEDTPINEARILYHEVLILEAQINKSYEIINGR